MAINVFVVMEQPAAYQVLQLLIGKRPDIELIGRANDEQDIVSQVVEAAPEVLLLTIASSKSDGITTAQQILRCWPSAKIIILATEATNAGLLEALQIGAKGYLHIESMEAELLQAIIAVFAGHRYINRTLWEELIDDYVLRCESSTQDPPAYIGS